MEFKDVVFGRRSIRKYTQEPVSDEDLKYIIDAGLYAPSGVDLQPWFFVVIKSPEQLDRLYSVMGGVSDAMTDNLKERFARHPQVAEDSLKFIRQLGGAVVCMLVFWQKQKYEKSDSTIYQSIGAAIENVLLAARDRGLGSCWLTAPLESGHAEQIREMFAPEHGQLAALLTIGHKSPDYKEFTPRRKDGRYVII